MLRTYAILNIFVLLDVLCVKNNTIILSNISNIIFHLEIRIKRISKLNSGGHGTIIWYKIEKDFIIHTANGIGHLKLEIIALTRRLFVKLGYH